MSLPGNVSEIRGTHPYVFRSGQWARIECTATVHRPEGDRECYLVQFEDSIIDLWPVDDQAACYEFR